MTTAPMQVDDRIDAHTLVSISYTHFAAGEFVKDTPPGKNADYFTSFVTDRFESRTRPSSINEVRVVSLPLENEG